MGKKKIAEDKKAELEAVQDTEMDEEWEDMGFIERFWQGNDRKINILIVTGGVIVMIALLGLLFTIMEYGKSERIYNQAQKEFVVILPEEGTSGEDSTVTQPSREWYEVASVDLEALQATYPDVVGWILFENEEISYPIVYSGDNEKYLRTTYTGKSATAGSIFLDGESTPDFSDPHTLIYGHNMKDLSMFGRLRYYKTEKDYYEDHRYFQIFTGGQIYRYEIFAYGDISAYSDIYEVYGSAPEDILGLIRELKRNSYQDTGVEVGASDHIITLSTCTGDGDVRMIVSAVRVDEH